MQTQIISLLHHAPLLTCQEPWQVTAVAEDAMCIVSQPWQRTQCALDVETWTPQTKVIFQTQYVCPQDQFVGESQAGESCASLTMYFQ